jgi:hypothetical protein
MQLQCNLNITRIYQIHKEAHSSGYLAEIHKVCLLISSYGTKVEKLCMAISTLLYHGHMKIRNNNSTLSAASKIT